MAFISKAEFSDRLAYQPSDQSITLSGSTNFYGTLMSKGIEIDATATSANTYNSLYFDGNKIILSEPRADRVGRRITQNSHGFIVGNVLGFDIGTNKYIKVYADVETSEEAIGIVTEVFDANSFYITFHGYVDNLAEMVDKNGDSLAADSVYYLAGSVGNAGLLSATEPSAIGKVSKPMLITFTTTTGIVLNYRGNEVVSGETLTGVTIGVGESILSSVSGSTMYFKSITGSTGISVIDNTTELILDLDNGLANLATFNTDGILVQTSNNNWKGVSLEQPAAGITISNPSGTTSGNIVFALANDLAALEGLTGGGIATRISGATWELRNLIEPAAGITITNSDGITGNPTFALANDLLALENLSSTGIAVRSSNDTWVQRTITGTSGNINVTNGSGVSGNPTINLAASGVAAGSDYNTFVVDTYGRITSAITLTYDNYSNWKLSAEGGTTTNISSTETVDFSGGSYVTARRSVNSIIFDASLNYVTGATFNTGNGNLTIKQNYYSDVVVDLDGRYSTTDYYVTGATFNTGNGNLTIKQNGLADISVDLDGRYSTTDYYVTGATFNTGNGNLTIKQNGLTDITVDLDGRYLTSVSIGPGVANRGTYWNGTNSITYSESWRYNGSGHTLYTGLNNGTIGDFANNGIKLLNLSGAVDTYEYQYSPAIQFRTSGYIAGNERTSSFYMFAQPTFGGGLGRNIFVINASTGLTAGSETSSGSVYIDDYGTISSSKAIIAVEGIFSSGFTGGYGSIIGSNSSDFVGRFYNIDGSVGADGIQVKAGSNTGGLLISLVRGDGFGVGNITHDGTNTTYGTSSDRALKKNIRESNFDHKWLNGILKDYEWVETNVHSTGVIAQELYNYFPYAVIKPLNDKNYWNVDYGKLTIPLISAYNDHEKRIQRIEQILNI